MSKKDQNVNVNAVSEIKDEILDMQTDGKNRGQIEGFLKYEYNMSNKDAKNAVQDALGKGAASNADWKATVTYIREHANEDKADIVAGIIGVRGSTESTAGHIYNYLKFAQEYGRQEVAALDAFSETDEDLDMIDELNDVEA